MSDENVFAMLQSMRSRHEIPRSSKTESAAQRAALLQPNGVMDWVRGNSLDRRTYEIRTLRRENS
jgi:hypothetical protein